MKRHAPKIIVGLVVIGLGLVCPVPVVGRVCCLKAESLGTGRFKIYF